MENLSSGSSLTVRSRTTASATSRRSNLEVIVMIVILLGEKRFLLKRQLSFGLGGQNCPKKVHNERHFIDQVKLPWYADCSWRDIRDIIPSLLILFIGNLSSHSLAFDPHHRTYSPPRDRHHDPDHTVRVCLGDQAASDGGGNSKVAHSWGKTPQKVKQSKYTSCMLQPMLQPRWLLPKQQRSSLTHGHLGSFYASIMLFQKQ